MSELALPRSRRAFLVLTNASFIHTENCDCRRRTGIFSGNEKSDPLGRFFDLQCFFQSKKKIWSGKRDSNSRPRPWQGRALPTELFPRIYNKNGVP